MDPNVQTGQVGLPHDTQGAEEGADYLRRLRNQAGEDTPPKRDSIVAPAATSSPAVTERRRSPRFQCSGSAEFRVEGSDVRMWGTLTDVSLHGCYVEMNSTFPVGTPVNLVIEAVGVRVRVQAAVRVSYPFLGMGMCFSEIEPGQQLQLEQLLAEVLRQSSLSASPATPVAHSINSLAEVDSRTMLDELAQFFRTNHLLSREEFYRIAKRARR